MVSDMLTNTIYRLSNGEITPWLESDLLESPNGLYIEGNNMIVGSWGNMTNGFATEVPGHLKRVSIDARVVESLGDGSPVGNLDGVESDGNGRYYVTGWLAEWGIVSYRFQWVFEKVITSGSRFRRS